MAMILGLVVAGGVHTAKSTFRPVVTATTGGVGNPVVSATEDGAAICMSVIALVAPILIGVILIVLLTLTLMVLRRRRASTA
jgi:hypothetical protein